MVQLVDDNDVSVAVPCKPFASERVLMANAAELNRDAATIADVRLKYPYPPKDCNDATIILQNLDEEIKTANEKIASGTSNRPAKRYLDAFLTVKADFKNWVNAKQCVQAAFQAENDAFTNQLQQALNNEKQDQTGKKSIDNLIIFGGLGLLLTVAIVIIVKKSKAKASAN